MKRDLYVTEIGHIFKDMRESRLFEDVYSKDDVEEILSELMTSVRDSVKRDLEATTSMSALVLEQVLSAADDGGVSVAVDMSKTEDSGSISRIRDLASAAGIGALGDLDVKRKNVVKLESMREEHNRLVADNLRLAEESAALRERYEAMQAAASAANRDKADAVAKLQAAHAEAAALRAGASEAAAVAATAAAHAAEIESLRSELARLHAQAEGAKTRALTAEKEREASVNSSKAFLMLKQLLTRKNAQLAELRAKVKKYEPEADDADA